jgi:hypothetical protein
MKKLLLILTLFSFQAVAVDQIRFFKRPLSCPLRFSSLSSIRDQVQSLVAVLGNGCTQNGQQAINQLNANVSNLEGIANSYNNYNNSTDATSSAQYAKNVGQILGNINLITSNNACFYDIRSRGLLPVLSDVVMSVSQLGLLIPSTQGATVAAGGYVIGSGIKIINELLKKKFNFEKPEERRAFIQLNCAFFDNRRMMEESGIFNPESDDFRDQIVSQLRLERIDILKAQRRNEKAILELDDTLNAAINSLPMARVMGLNPAYLRRLDEILATLGKRPADYAEKLRQVSFLSENAADILEAAKNIKFNSRVESSRKLLIANLEKILPDLAANARAWTNSIDEYEMNIRGPLMAFLIPVSDSFKKELMTIEAELAIIEPATAKKITKLRLEIKSNQASAWALALRQTSIESKISSFEKLRSEGLFSDNDEGSSNAVEILDYYRTLQNSILGDEGRDYLKNAIKTGYNMKDGLNEQLRLFEQARNPRETCSATEKIRFAWAQYKYKVQETHDFIATNFDLYRSNFRIGSETLKRSTRFVLEQIESVHRFNELNVPEENTVGELMLDVASKVSGVEAKLRTSGCF